LDYLKIISQDEKARMAYEAREAELMDQRTRIKSAYLKGEEIGIEKGKAEIIHAMLSKGMSVEDIASIVSMDVRSVIEIVSARTNSM
jgi:predicted transposase/invertase (TIGR01784 family)